jgi:peptidoglycan-associated lipoprotein
MRNTSFAIALVAIVALTGCGKKAVTAPPPPPPVAPSVPPPAPPPTDAPEPIVRDPYVDLCAMDSAALEAMGLVGDIHFDFDSSDLRADDQATLRRNADKMKELDFLRVTVEGHADERGTVDYNLALGERRAKAAFDYLATLGVPADRMKVVSYGKEIPLCRESTEECWARNRRGHFAITGKIPTERCQR